MFLPCARAGGPRSQANGGAPLHPGGVDVSVNRKFGPVVLTEGYTRLNAIGVLLGGFSIIPLLAFMGLIMPSLLLDVFRIDPAFHGRLTGNLGVLQEVVVLLLIGVVGAASDNFGRRVIMVVGLCLVGLGLLVYPLAENELQIYGYRAVFALGAGTAPIMYGASIQDTPVNRSRGQFIGFGSIATGVGIMVMSLTVGRLPEYLVARGVSPQDAGIYTCWCMVAFAAAAAVMVRMTWRAGRVAASEPREPVWRNLGEGFSEAVRNPRIALAYLTSFASRGDLVVILTFLALWVVQEGTDQGLTAAEGTLRAGIMIAAVQGIGVLVAYFIGRFVDRINRVLAVCIAFAVASAAYFGMAMVEDPYMNIAIVACMFAGIGEISVIITGNALLGQEAPKARRGAVVGVFGVFGAFSILCTSFFGGIVFDKISRVAPFAMMGIVNLIVAVVALFVLLRAPGMSAREVRTST